MTNSTSGSRPAAVSVSFALWLIAIVVGIVTVVVLFVSAGTVVSAGESSATANFFGITYVFVALLVLFFTATQAVVVRRMRAGRNWARVLLTALAVLQIFNAVFSIGLNAIVSLIGIVVVTAATVSMWLPASNAYFGRRTTLAP